MKSFKLNAFEKFVIRNKKVLYIFILIAFFVVNILFSHFKYPMIIPTDTFIFAVPVLIIFLYTELLPIFKKAKIVAAHSKLNMDFSLDGITKLINALNPKDTEFLPTLRNNKASYFIDAGNFAEAEEELKLIFQDFDAKKLSPSNLFDIHLNFALIKIQNGDEEGYKEQLRIVEGYYEKIKKSAYICIMRHTLNTVLLYAAARFEPYSVDFEQRVLTHLRFFEGKKNKKIDPLDYFNAYSILFNYFARFENTEKAVYYANEIVKIGNDSFYEYRKAKEYLENADKCN